jgi:hypothetical protein
MILMDGFDHHVPFLLRLEGSCSGVVEVYDRGCWGAAQDVSALYYSPLHG